MKIRIERRMTLPTRNSPFLLWSRHLLFVIGILALSYVGFALLDTRLFQAAQSRQFQQELNGLKPPVGSDEYRHAPSLPPDAIAWTLSKWSSPKTLKCWPIPMTQF